MLDKKYGTKTLCDVLNNTSCQMTIEKRNDIFEEMFNDMCCRSYLQLNLEEEIDFSYNDIDEAKETAINCKKHNMDNNIYERTKMIYGHYSNIDSMEVETFNMHTYSYKDIETNKIKQITTEDGKTDALSILLEVYDRCNSNCTNLGYCVVHHSKNGDAEGYYSVYTFVKWEFPFFRLHSTWTIKGETRPVSG